MTVFRYIFKIFTQSVLEQLFSFIPETFSAVIEDQSRFNFRHAQKAECLESTQLEASVIHLLCLQ